MDTREFREAGHQTIDLLGEYLEGVEERPLFPTVEPAELQKLFDEPLPTGPTDPETLFKEIREKLLPYSSHVNHPGYFGLMTSTPTAMGILGDLIASTLNQNLGTWTIGPSAITVERQTLRWLTDLVGYGPEAGGNLTSGGMMANLIGLKLGRDAITGRAHHEGIRDRWAVYTNEERHVSIDKSVDLLGMGREGLRALPTDDEFRLDVNALEAAIAEDKKNGVKPLCIVAIMGTTNTGSVDPIRRLREIADREGMWLHADAAYGGGVLLSEKRRGLLDGVEIADSITVDPHKWFYAPIDAGAILVKDGKRLTESFGLRPPYLRDDGGDRYQFYVHGLEQSRRFRSLKVWLSFKRYGTKQVGEWIDRDISNVEHMTKLVEAAPDFELVCRPPMACLCIRYLREGLDGETLGRLHREVTGRIEAQGRFWISSTILKGRYAFRINPINLRTRPHHMEELMAALQRECAAFPVDG